MSRKYKRTSRPKTSRPKNAIRVKAHIKQTKTGSHRVAAHWRKGPPKKATGQSVEPHTQRKSNKVRVYL
jgi:hypothetical protein